MAHLALDNTMGIGLIAVVMAATLYGVTCLQVWYYCRHYYHSDGWPIRAGVAITWACDTVHQALITHAVYIYLVTNYNNPAELANIVWSLILEVLFSGIVAMIVQSFFTVRIWKLSNHNILLAVVLVLLIISQLALVIAYVSQCLPVQTYVELTRYKHLSMSINAVGAVTDVLIAAVFCTVLHTSRTGFKRSDSMINKLIIYSVNTGLLTSLCATASLITIIISPTTFIYIGFFLILSRLYCNSFLATLNARKAIRGQGNASPYSLSLQMVDGYNSAAPTPGTDIAIKIETAQEFMTDHKSSKSSDPHKKLEVRDVV